MFSFLYDIECLVYHSVIFYDKRKKQLAQTQGTVKIP